MTNLRKIPIFPLHDVVFFPETLLPLHIFEPRYRQMVSEAWATERLIGMALLLPDADPSSNDAPVFDLGCAGEIVQLTELEDGRFDIVLEGRFRYRLAHDVRNEPFRIAEVEELPKLVLEGPDSLRELLRNRLTRASEKLSRGLGRDDEPFQADISDEGLAGQAAMRMALDSAERYRLLGQQNLAERFAWTLARIEETQAQLDFLAPFRGHADDPRWN